MLLRQLSNLARHRHASGKRPRGQQSASSSAVAAASLRAPPLWQHAGSAAILAVVQCGVFALYTSCTDDDEKRQAFIHTHGLSLWRVQHTTTPGDYIRAHVEYAFISSGWVELVAGGAATAGAALLAARGLPPVGSSMAGPAIFLACAAVAGLGGNMSSFTAVDAFLQTGASLDAEFLYRYTFTGALPGAVGLTAFAAASQARKQPLLALATLPLLATVAAAGMLPPQEPLPRAVTAATALFGTTSNYMNALGGATGVGCWVLSVLLARLRRGGRLPSALPRAR